MSKVFCKDEVSVCDTEIVFAIMPFHRLSTPALGASILQKCLLDKGLNSKILYLGFSLAELIGLKAYTNILNSHTPHLVGEWLFSKYTFPDNEFNHSNFTWRTPTLTSYLDDVAIWVEQVASEVLSYSPRIVICSSLFQQNVSSLALLKAVKSIDPSVTTIMGGPNTEGILGLALLRRCPWLDYVSSGDGEEVLPRLCNQILTSKLESLPPGVNSRNTLKDLEPLDQQTSFSRASLLDVNMSPLPCYEDYFEAVNKTKFSIIPSLFLESSRGCWWGERSQCTFCGLNGDSMRFRSKDAGRVLNDMNSLKAEYNVSSIQFVDNILDKKYLSTLLPALEGQKFDIFYETKADLSENHFIKLSSAGVNFIQPGIESLSTPVLSLMKKGTRSSVNIRCIRLCREYGIFPSWTILFDFPSEEPSLYEECSRLMPHLVHLPPPSGFTPIRFDRYSPYHDNPHLWGLDLVPYDSYKAVYPPFNNCHNDIAYFFKRHGLSDCDVHPYSHLTGPYKLCSDQVDHWRSCWVHKSSMDHIPILQLFCDENKQDPYIMDSRYSTDCIKSKISHSMLDLLRFCRDVVSYTRLSAAFNDPNIFFDDSDLIYALDHNWVINDESTYVSVVLTKVIAFDFHKPPGGRVLPSPI